MKTHLRRDLAHASFLAIAACALLACSAGKSDGTATALDAGNGDGDAMRSDGSIDDVGGTDGIGADDSSSDGAVADSADTDPAGDAIVSDSVSDVPPKIAVVYAHSADTLYRLDPTTLTVTKIGAFVDTSGGAITSMTDIALDQAATMYGVTFTELYRIDYKAAKPTCTKLATLSTSFNGLTFVPAGMLDVGKEVLVGSSNDGGWHRIDIVPPSSATVTKIGSYGSGWMSSGDTVGIIGDQVYATVSNGLGNDHVIVIDPKTGALKKDLGDTGVSGLWGVGYWDGVMYGFASSGSLYKIDLKTAKATEIPLGASKPAGGWWGAGVTTSAPRGIF